MTIEKLEKSNQIEWRIRELNQLLESYAEPKNPEEQVHPSSYNFIQRALRSNIAFEQSISFVKALKSIIETKLSELQKEFDEL